MATRFGRMVRKRYLILWSLRLVRSHDKLKPLYLQCNNAYDHQAWQDGDLPCGVLIVIVTWPINYVVLLDHFFLLSSLFIVDLNYLLHFVIIASIYIIMVDSVLHWKWKANWRQLNCNDVYIRGFYVLNKSYLRQIYFA